MAEPHGRTGTGEMGAGASVEACGCAEGCDAAWAARLELQSFLTMANGHMPERIVDFAAPRDVLEQHLGRYRWALPTVQGRDVLDMACGTGYGSHLLASAGLAASVLGVDIDSESIRYARLRYRLPNLRYLEADACTWRADRKFAVICSFETIEHVPAPDSLLASVVAMMSPDGSLFVSSPVRTFGDLRDKPPHNPFHLREWTIPEFRSMLELYFEYVEIRSQVWPIKLGFGGRFRLPGRVSRFLGRYAGLSSGRQGQLIADVIPFSARPPLWTPPLPRYQVALCRSPRPAPDAALVRRLCYGESG